MGSSQKKSQLKSNKRQGSSPVNHSDKLSSKVLRQLLQNHCGCINDDDAIDSRTWFKSSDGTKRDRKALQLCRQVADTLNYVLSGTDDRRSGDPLLENLQVLSVIPAPDARRLLVTVTQTDLPSDSTTVDATLAALRLHTPRLRAEIATSITRRKIPNLCFEFAHTALPQTKEGRNE